MRYDYLFISLLFSLLSFAKVGFGQNNEEQCASHLLHNKLLLNDPEYAQRHKAYEHQIQDLVDAIQMNSSNAQAQVFGDTLEIPVVVHVIHTGQNVGVGANISTAQINGAMTALNDRYRKTPGTHGDAAGVDTEIQFVLAKRDPDCNATTGIVRVDGSSVTDYASEGITAGQGSGADELEVKALSRWPATDYLNIWVVTEIENNNGGFGIQGYAYFPGVSAVRDGVVIMHTAFGTSGTVNSWNNLNRTFTHEVGHYLNLYHTFEGDNSGNNCPTTTNGCGSGVGDCCADTEPHIRASSNCPTGTNGCTSSAWANVQHNYMNYSSQSCADMFTEDQSDRMRAALFGPRSSLLSSLGTEAPSTSTVASASCSPNTTNLTNGFGIGITNVTFENFDVTSSSAVPDSGYRDYSCHHMAEVFPSTNYPISINTGLSNNEDVRVYIDYNDDGDFEDSSELVFTSDTDTLHTGSFTIPSGATQNTPLRMRVISDWHGNTTAMNAGESCYAPQYGQVEDYAIFVKGTMTASVSATNATCNGGSNGSLTVTVSSGTANYDYSWSNGSSTNNSNSATNTVTGLAAGTYTVTVTDGNSNTVTATGTVGEPSALLVNVTANNMVSCFNGNDGSMTANASGGTPTYGYLWSTGSTNQTITGVTAGTYSLTVTDAAGCTDSSSISITQPSSAVVASISVDSIPACGGSNGQLTASGSGGTLPYTYVWVIGSTSSTINGLTAGTYTVTVTDANGCTDTEVSNLSGGSSISLTVSVDSNASCGSSTGVLTANASGGSGALSYSWSNSASTASISGLTAGTYTVTVSDSSGCSATESATVLGGSNISLSITIDSNASCNSTSGALTANASGGSGALSYSWSNSATTASISGLVNGTYTVTVSDSSGCSTTESATMAGGPPINLSISIDSNAGCGGSLGGLTANASGGAGALSYLWSNAANTSSIAGLIAGTYTVTVSDSTGCSSTDSETITSSGASVNSTTNLSICNGDSVMVHGTLVGTTGTFVDTLTASGGCDSISTVIVSQGLGSYAFQLEWIYQGDSVFVGGAFQTVSDIYIDTFANSQGCDSIVETMLWVYPVNFGSSAITICQGDSVMLGGVYRTTAGNYTDTSFVGGTANINTVTLSVNTPVTISTSAQINNGDSMYLAGTWRTTSGTYCDTIGTCDSVLCTTLTVNTVTYTAIPTTAQICSGDSVLLGGQFRSTAGTYEDTVGNGFGTDTIFITELSIDPNSIILYSAGLWLKSNQVNPPFQWYDCDSGIVINTTQEGYFMPGYSGNFAVINVSATCSDTSACVFHSNTNKTSLDVRGYPTAVVDYYTIVFDYLQKDITIDVYDLQGQLIYSHEADEAIQLSLPLSQVASGYYLVNIGTAEGRETLKFAKVID